MATTFNSISLGGRVTQGIFEQMGFDTPTAGLFTHQLLLDSLIVQTVLFLAAYLLLQGYKTKCLVADAPPPLDDVQRKTVILVLVMLGLVIVPSLLAAIMPGQALLVSISSAADPTFISLLGVILALICKIGDERSALAKVPWSIIILLCGMGMLISVATRAGTIDALAHWLGLHVGVNSVVYATGVCAGIMSFFSSTLGVVMPTLYPIVPGLAAQTGVSPTVLFSVITSCAIMTGFSPFSSAGAMALAGVQEETERSRLFYQLFMVPVLGIAVVFALAFLRVLG
jgi:di/tricarboxylate transporter